MQISRYQYKGLMMATMARQAAKIGLAMAVLMLGENLVANPSRSELKLQASRDQIPEVMKLKILENKDNSEWIRIETKGTQVKLLHTRNTISGFSQLPVIPGMIPKFYVWYDHPASKVVFKPDDCSMAATDPSTISPTCLISENNDTLNLPQGTNIRKGLFTIEYSEGGFVRTVAFRIPDELLPSDTPSAKPEQLEATRSEKKREK